MCENVTEVVRTVRRELRLREVGRPRHTFAGVDVPTVGIRIAVLVAQDAAVPPAFEKSARVDAVLPRAVAIKNRMCPARAELPQDAAAASRPQTIAPRRNKKYRAARLFRCSKAAYPPIQWHRRSRETPQENSDQADPATCPLHGSPR